ncbi:Zinc finger CCCH domain-containing protein 15-like protein [Smittium culicis]|uniref:Zinc finger CCCH domain-containing protein 15-like protein n=1 Tax=Smittium culicis TaxID=133412 RepID=A0A1R1YHK6_9FUNG|nr:Zinc finger CCCH domain-containing protein 15-like protein [Smittium culicis]
MPPKKAQSTKSVQKDKKKLIEDKTFGLKNKNKSSKVNKYIQQVESQVQAAGNRKVQKSAEEQKSLALQKKELQQKKDEELALLFNPIIQQKVPFGVDPKTILCQSFKAGVCKKGDKCKFSHDLNVGRKVTKIDMYTDKRGGPNNKNEDLMENWDLAKLESVVNSKKNPATTTDIVCKNFLEAIESGKYGWFWVCPNGAEKCKYKHALPPGFVFKAKKSDNDEEKEEISLEEFLEVERHKLGTNLTPVTYESFDLWKKTRTDKKSAEEEAERSRKEAAFKAGKNVKMSGRDFFDFNPDWNKDEDDEDDTFDISVYKNADGEYTNEENNRNNSSSDNNINQNDGSNSKEISDISTTNNDSVEIST